MSELTAHEKRVLTVIASFQPVTRGELGDILGRDISRDTIAALRGDELIATGPRRPQPGAPYTYVTTRPSFPFRALQACTNCPTSTGSKTPACSARSRCPKSCAARSASRAMTKMAPRSMRMKTAKMMKNTWASDWSRNERFPAAVSSGPRR